MEKNLPAKPGDMDSIPGLEDSTNQLLSRHATTVEAHAPQQEKPCNKGRPLLTTTAGSPSACGPTDCSLASSSVRGIFQAGTLEQVITSYFRGTPDPGIKPTSPVSPALAGGFLSSSTIQEAPRMAGRE